jgi:hypothetical protein
VTSLASWDGRVLAVGSAEVWSQPATTGQLFEEAFNVTPPSVCDASFAQEPVVPFFMQQASLLDVNCLTKRAYNQQQQTLG